MLRQGAGVEFERFDARAVAHRGAHAAHARHQLIDRAQLVQRRPVRVALAPAGLGRQPHRERLGKVLGRMRLRVPFAQMMHVAPATGACPVARRIRKRGGSKHGSPAFAPPQPVGVVERVSGLVTQDTQQQPCVAALRLAHDAPLEPLQARMREIERHRNARHTVGRKPLLGQPHVRADTDAAALEVRIQPPHMRGKRGALDGKLQIAKAPGQQLLVGQTHPGPSLGARGDFRPACRGHACEANVRGNTGKRAYPERSRAVCYGGSGFVALSGRRGGQPLNSSIAWASSRSALLSINCFLIRLLRHKVGIALAV